MPPPGAGGLPPPPQVATGDAAAPATPPVADGGKKKKLMLVGGAAVVLAGLGFGVMSFLASPAPEPPPVRKAAVPAAPAAQPPAAPDSTGPIGTTKQMIAQAQTAHADPTSEAAGASPPAAPGNGGEPAAAAPTAANSPAAAPAAGAIAPAVIAPVPSAPPPASAAFKAWVQNLKISGVRGGANPRVFIERTAYGPGDLVNPQLGISFESYNVETRMLLFRDKSGAVVERRN